MSINADVSHGGFPSKRTNSSLEVGLTIVVISGVKADPNVPISVESLYARKYKKLNR